MSFTKEQMQKAIAVELDQFLYFGDGYFFNPDTKCAEYIPLVDIPICDTRSLAAIADQMRYKAGFPPFFPTGDMLESEYDLSGWYNFYVCLNKLDTYIYFIPISDVAKDAETDYQIPLTHEEKMWLYDILDEQCKKVHNMDCAELLQEAEIVTKEDAHHA